MIFLLPIFFLALAGVFKAMADTLQHHFDSSIFKNLNPKWWNPAESWEHVGFIPLTEYRADGWHLANSGMIIFFTLAASIHEPYFKWYIELPAGGAIVIMSFNLFYNRIFRKK
jgi:hypothetical protein